MKVKNLSLCFFLLTLLILFTPQALAEEKLSGPSASFAAILKAKVADHRVQILHSYLEKYNSPLTPYAGTFVREADRYGIDWKLVVSISGVESTFGKAEPEGCNNGWGYGIYGDNMLCFTSYNDAIHTISQALREKYLNKWGATDVYSIGHLYAASPTWADRVTYFMNDIDAYQHGLEDNQPLSISL